MIYLLLVLKKKLDILTDNHLKTLMNIYTEKQSQYYSLHNKNLELYEENLCRTN